MKKKFLFIKMLVCFCLSLNYGQNEAILNTGEKVLLFEDKTWEYLDSIPLYSLKISNLVKLEIPKIGSHEILIDHFAYSLVYNESHEQASFVAYELTKEETVKSYERTDKFLVDPKIKSGTANDKDYSGSGYDRGHLAPAADMGWSETAMKESFFYSNISPQSPSFNRGIWKNLEALVRTWAVEYNSVYIVTGGVLVPGLTAIGSNKVSVPNHFYKVVLDYSEPDIKGIGFIIPNTGSQAELWSFAVSIDSVERLTGLDFFYQLPDNQEELIEKTICTKCWTWKAINFSVDKNDSSTTTSVQCKGNTQKGERCKNNTLNESGYCYLHESQSGSKSKTETVQPKPQSRSKSVQCSGRTQAGNRCKRMTTSSNGRCYQH